MSKEKVLNQIIRIRDKCMRETISKNISYLKERKHQELMDLLDTTLILIRKNQLVGTIYIQPLPSEYGIASIGGFACEQEGYGHKLFVSTLQRAWNLGYQHAISVTASDKAKGIFKQHGAVPQNGQFDDYLNIARERYETEKDLAQLFLFTKPQ